MDIGAVVRLAPIKDVKTMIYAFFELHERLPKVRLHIMAAWTTRSTAPSATRWSKPWACAT